MDTPEPLPPYLEAKIKWAREDVTAKIRGTYLEKVLDYELFSLEQRFDEATRQGSKQLAMAALEYAQQVLYLADKYAKPG